HADDRIGDDPDGFIDGYSDPMTFVRSLQLLLAPPWQPRPASGLAARGGVKIDLEEFPNSSFLAVLLCGQSRPLDYMLPGQLFEHLDLLKVELRSLQERAIISALLPQCGPTYKEADIVRRKRPECRPLGAGAPIRLARRQRRAELVEGIGQLGLGAVRTGPS